jgi:hypothetical protein
MTMWQVFRRVTFSVSLHATSTEMIFPHGTASPEAACRPIERFHGSLGAASPPLD